MNDFYFVSFLITVFSISIVITLILGIGHGKYLERKRLLGLTESTYRKGYAAGSDRKIRVAMDMGNPEFILLALTDEIETNLFSAKHREN